jgi:hypothetical protein
MSEIDTATTASEPGLETRLRATTGQTAFLAAFLLAEAGVLAYTFLRLWPDVPNGEAPAAFTAIGIVFSPEIRILLLVMCAGGLGSFIHAATSFADYAGNQRLGTHWFWWYVLRLPIGMVLALGIYAVVRGGLLAPGAGPENVSRFGITAIAFLSGMFSKQATDKLDELFKTFFKTSPTGGDAQRKDKLAPAALAIETVAPSPAPVGVVQLTIDGSGFTDSTVISINGKKISPKLVSSTRVTVDVPLEFAQPGTLMVKAIDRGQESAAVTVRVGT